MTLIQAAVPTKDFIGLKVLERGLPARWYYDVEQYELELTKIWYRGWIYVGNSQEVSQPRSYLTFELGDQTLLLVRDQFGELRGFHNTCRHRGAELCAPGRGVLNNQSLICPYHAWVYNLRGELIRTSSKSIPSNFSVDDLGLYGVKVTEWRGMIFASLGEDPSPFTDSVGAGLGVLDHWPLEEMVVGPVLTKYVACNWKIFWENFNECLHCPAVHPKLSQLMPIFGRGLLTERDDPQWRAHQADPHPKYRGGICEGAETLSMDGRITGRAIETLTDRERKAGVTYWTFLPTVFIAAHIDHVRVVRVRPLGPERMELRSEFLFEPETSTADGFDPGNVVDFANTVMTEDANICEVNQRGLRSARHATGVLMPEEYLLKSFHDWIRSQLALG